MNAIRAAALLVAFLPSIAFALPSVSVTRFPRGMIQAIGASPATDDFTLLNSGPDPASVTITQSGSFFSVSPASFTLAAGASRVLTISTPALSGGMYPGTINVSVAGVPQPLIIPVRLFIGAQGQGSVNITGGGTVEVSGLPGQLHAGGFNLGNTGSTGSQGILTADVPWLDHPTISIGIPSQSSPRISFTVDPSLRSDGVAPLGAVFGTMSFSYMTGTSNSGPATARLAVPVTDITKAVVVPQPPSALLPGETALFLPGVVNGVTDLILSNRSAERALSDLRLFYTAAGASTASSLMANVPQLPASFSAMFPFGQSTLFNASGQTGTIQVRHALIENVALYALRISPFADLQYFTVLPAFRSDSSVAPGDRLLFAGVERTGSTATHIVLQETGGFTAAFTIEFFDGGGAPVAPNRNGSLLPFGYLSVADAVPAGAQSARVSFTSDGAARLTGYASVVDSVTQDSWIILDSSRIAAQPSGYSIVPYPSLAGTPLARFEIYVTNGSAEPAAVTVGRRLPARRRGSSRGSAATPDPDTFMLAPRATRRMTVTSPPLGYIPISGPTGAISASGRLTVTAAGRNGVFGAGVPALPLSVAAGVGSRKRFSRVSDVPNVSPPTLFLLETDGKSVTARVTIRFSFPAGSAVSGQVTASKDYAVASGQLLTIPDVTRSILGAQRDSVGIVHNLLVDVEVVSGEGHMLTYLQTNDRSGDITIAID